MKPKIGDKVRVTYLGVYYDNTGTVTATSTDFTPDGIVVHMDPGSYKYDEFPDVIFLAHHLELMKPKCKRHDSV